MTGSLKEGCPEKREPQKQERQRIGEKSWELGISTI